VGEPSPGLAALLGFIPGVGAMYNGQYAKGIVHLIVFAVLVSLASDVNGIFGLFVAGWICYMVIEAHHTATARRDGTPLPNPFGLNDLSERLGFGKAWPSGTPHATATNASAYPPPASSTPDDSPMAGGADTFFYQAADVSQPYTTPGGPAMPPSAAPADLPVPYYRRFPSGAIWLIIFGVIFLVGDTGFFHIFHQRVFWPIFLIAAGVWVFVHKMIVTGHGLENDGTEFYRWRLARAIHNSVWIVLVGVLWLLDVLGILSWSRSWPLFLIAGGVLQLFKRSLPGRYGFTGYGSSSSATGSGPSSNTPPEKTVTGSESMPSEPAHDAPGGESGDSLNNDGERR